MNLYARFSLVVILLSVPVLSRAQEPVRVGVMDFAGKAGVDQEDADVLADLLAAELSQMGDVQVISGQDIQSLLNLEKQKRLMGCTSDECISEIGGALGLRWMVSGSVAKFGATYVLNLKLSDAVRFEVINRVVRTVRDEKDMLLAVLPGAVHELFAPAREQVGLVMAETSSVAARHYQPLKQSPAAVTVITRDDIEASGATTIPDLLRIVPGMEVTIVNRTYSLITARQNLNIDGHDFLVLIDGREANIELLGPVLWEAQPISLDDIERIEIIRGPGSALYGANALAGVVSITTRAVPEEPSFRVNLEVGEVGSISAGALASSRIGNLGFSISGKAETGGEFVDPRQLGKEVMKIRSTVEYRWSEGRRLLLDGGFAAGKGDIPTGVGEFDFEGQVRTLRLAYESDDIRGQLYWMQVPCSVGMKNPLEFRGILLAEIIPFDIVGHTVDAEVQWTLPRFWDPLLIISGVMGRASYVSSDQLLDAETYSDITSPRYHQPGISHWEGRTGVFVHTELFPAEWVTLTGDLRFDYSTVTDEFISPRLAAVFMLVPEHFLRVGAARSFRKPAFMDTHAHLNVSIPQESPITGSEEEFKEFMTRVIGNSDLDNEKQLSFEAGYRGTFLDKRVGITFNIFYNMLTDQVTVDNNIILTEQGLPDLTRSSFLNKSAKDYDVLGSELAIRIDPIKNLSLLASWTYRAVYQPNGRLSDENPKNLFKLGARFRTESGLVGSLYAFSRSEHTTGVLNPGGMLERPLKDHIDNTVLVLGRIGWRLKPLRGLEFEAGLKLFLPISPFSSPHFRYSDTGSVMSASGELFGGEILSRLVVGYLHGSF